jgi:hypothetical protein
MRQKEHFEEQKILSSNARRKKRDLVGTVGHNKTLEGYQRDSKQETSPLLEAVKVKVKVKVESDDKDDKEEEDEESLDDDDNEEQRRRTRRTGRATSSVS